MAMATSRRGFPTDFPVVGFAADFPCRQSGRGFPTDFPVVGFRDKFQQALLAVASLPISLW